MLRFPLAPFMLFPGDLEELTDVLGDGPKDPFTSRVYVLYPPPLLPCYLSPGRYCLVVFSRKSIDLSHNFHCAFSLSRIVEFLGMSSHPPAVMYVRTFRLQPFWKVFHSCDYCFFALSLARSMCLHVMYFWSSMKPIAFRIPARRFPLRALPSSIPY